MDGVTWSKSIPDCFRFTEAVYRRYRMHIRLTHHSSPLLLFLKSKPHWQLELEVFYRLILSSRTWLSAVVLRLETTFFEVSSSFLLFHATRVSFFCHRKLCVAAVAGQVATDTEISDLNGTNMVK